MQFRPVKKMGLGAASSTGFVELAYILKKGIELGFFPKNFESLINGLSEPNYESYNFRPWLDAYKSINKDFIFPGKIGMLPTQNCNCDRCNDTFCSTIFQIKNLFSQLGGLAEIQNAYENVYNSFVATLLYIVANEFEGNALAEAEKLLGALMQSVPAELQNKILGISDSNIKYASAQKETVDVRGTQPNQRTTTDTEMMYEIGSQSALHQNSSTTSTTQNYYVAAESKTPEAQGNNYWWYVGGGALVVGGIVTAVVLLTPKKKKKKRR